MAQNPAKVDKDVVSLTDQSTKKEVVKVTEETHSTEEASDEVTKVPKTATTTTAIDEPQNSSVICPSRTLLLFFILSISFAVIISFWIKW